MASLVGEWAALVNPFVVGCPTYLFAKGNLLIHSDIQKHCCWGVTYLTGLICKHVCTNKYYSCKMEQYRPKGDCGLVSVLDPNHMH